MVPVIQTRAIHLYPARDRDQGPAIRDRKGITRLHRIIPYALMKFLNREGVRDYGNGIALDDAPARIGEIIACEPD